MDIQQLLRDPVLFTAELSGLRLRSYQQQVALAIIDSVLHRRGRTFVVMFPRQSGKNELQAQIEAYLLLALCRTDADLVKISPTWQPQAQNAMHRLERVLARNALTCRSWKKENGYIYRIGRARITFLSGAPESNIVGATASALLEVDEAQDVRIDKFDREVAPMAASTNATRVFWGTAWTSQTLLARELRAAREVERTLAGEACPRAFVLGADVVAREVPAYGEFVAGQVARLGRNHPLVKTQFFSEEIDEQGGMFPPWRLALMGLGDPHLPDPLPPALREEHTTFAFLLDVAGEGEVSHERDATALTIVQVDLSTLADPLLRAPAYRVVRRRSWVGARHAQIYGEVLALAEAYRARWVVVDATGVGAGLASFLERALPGRVIPFLFNQSSKSRLGWGFLGVVDSGRWKEEVVSDQWIVASERIKSSLTTNHQPLTTEFLLQLTFCQSTILPGPGRVMRWGVPDGTRDPASGALVHDDWIMSAALCALLDDAPWGAPSGGQVHIVRAKDPLDEMTGF